ncbi:pectate lyase [Hymenobacter crusticola]|uniref:Pectate lyase n=1 Tax=Hymenobacter crusticola TaxID=1770526 RepID=A0A243WEI0_9BACT|nr:pectate lyase [Hymenobacter crusticola]
MVVGCLAWPSSASAQKPKVVKPLPPLSAEKGDKLVYVADEKGNRIPDFSYCGYAASEKAIPDAPVRILVPLKSGDATQRIQAALDYVATLPASRDGIRGAVLLEKGTYEVAGGLQIKASGVVLRGNGMGEDGTILLGSGLSRETLVRILGKNDRKLAAAAPVADAYVPVNATKIRVAKAGAFKAGDQVLVHRPTTKEWLQELGTLEFGGGISALGWKPGTREIDWDRQVVAVEGDVLTLDAPLTTALDATYGGGTVRTYRWPSRITQVGVENLRCRSSFDAKNPKDEAHRWMAISLENTADAWVRQVVFEHFAGSAVAAFETAKRVTVEDCKNLAPVSEIGGQRRNAFYTNGQQTLFQRLYSEHGYHDFTVGYAAPGPNAFVQGQTYESLSFSGATDSWASGVLFDVVNIDGNALSYANRGQDGQGAGWCAANSVFWQCTAARIDCFQPPTAQNWAFGSWAQFQGNGYWGESNNSIQPRSLYYAQLAERLGNNLAVKPHVMPVQTEASSSPSVKVANELTANSTQPAPQLANWITQASQRQPISVAAGGVKTIDQVKTKSSASQPSAAPMRVVNGWLVRGTNLVTGSRQDVPWWNSSVRPEVLKSAGEAITRYVPGRTGRGLTDDLAQLTDSMLSRHQVGIEQNYALWYERRRDDHERVRRLDGDVWPPFYEVPFARSGQETAWDGLSKYDLTKYNPWYWGRLRQFADLADQKGLVLIHQNYFQHNIIEAGAHYADFTWRPVNNINNTGFPEPPPYAGDKRIFMAEQFYDVNHPIRRALHRAYIRQCLNNFTANNGVIQLIGAEFTGPLHFVQFWLDTIKEWEQETGKNALVGLSTTKDVQDAILADPARAAVVDIIDIRYWHYQADGKAYAPEGGQNLAPRQHARLLKPKASSFDQVYRAVHEYRQRYPEKAVIYSGDGADKFGWAVLMAGGSLPDVPAVPEARFLAAAAAMPVAAQPTEQPENTAKQFALVSPGKSYIQYCDANMPAQIDLSKATGSFRVHWLDAKDGHLIGKEQKVKGGKALELKNPQASPAILWVEHA